MTRRRRETGTRKETETEAETCRERERFYELTINPLYQALICCLLKFVLSMRNVMSSFDSFLLPDPPISPTIDEIRA